MGPDLLPIARDVQVEHLPGPTSGSRILGR